MAASIGTTGQAAGSAASMSNAGWCTSCGRCLWKSSRRQVDRMRWTEQELAEMRAFDAELDEQEAAGF